MEHNLQILCPSCKNLNTGKDKCAFCGTLLEASTENHAFMEKPSSASELVRNDPIERSERDLFREEMPPPIPLPRPKANPPLNFAGFWIRTGAFLLDSIFICIVFIILVYACLLGYLFGAGAHLSFSGLLTIFSAQMNIFNSIAFVINLIYFPVFLSYNGQTPGKMICRLKVIRIDGSSLSFLRALWRTLGYYLNQFTLLIGFLWVAVDNRKQGFHDKIAGTIEIRLTP